MRRAAGFAFWLALAGPAVVTLAFVLRYGVNVPYADQWTIVNLLARIETGTVQWSELLAQHNEHRMLFPKLVMVGLSRVTHWNVRAEMMASFALVVASLALLLAQARPLLGTTGPIVRFWAAFTASALLFSLAQWENWLWGWQLQWFLAVFAAIVSIALAGWSLESRRSGLLVAGAALAVIVSHYSLASGVVLWPLVGAILAFHPRRRLVLPLWIALAVVATTLYLIGYTRPSHHPSMMAVIERPLAFLLYVGNYLSGPIGRHAWIGLVAAMAFLVAATLAARRHRHSPQRVLPWIALGVFVLANAALTGIGRLGFGAAQALDSRYSTIAALLPIATMPLAILGLREARPWLRWAAVVPALALTLLTLRGDVRGADDFAGFNSRMVAGRSCLLSLDRASDDCLRHLYPQPAIVRSFSNWLVTVGWSGFGPPEARRIRSLALTDAAGRRNWRVLLEDGTHGIFDEARLEGDTLLAHGWAVHPRRREQPRQRVLVVAGNAVVGEAETIRERPDVAAHLGDPSLLTSGWIARVQPFTSRASPLTLRAYLVVEDGVLAPLQSSKRLP